MLGKSNEGGLIPRAFFAHSPCDSTVMFRYYLLYKGATVTAAPSGLYTRLCHAFLVSFFLSYLIYRKTIIFTPNESVLSADD